MIHHIQERCKLSSTNDCPTILYEDNVVCITHVTPRYYTIDCSQGRVTVKVYTSTSIEYLYITTIIILISKACSITLHSKEKLNLHTSITKYQKRNF